MTNASAGVLNASEQRDPVHTYWLKALTITSEYAVLPLRTRSPHNPGQYAGQLHEINEFLGDTLTSLLKVVTGDSQFLEYVAMLSAVTLCISSYTGCRFVAIASPTRSSPREKPVSAHALPVLSSVDPDITFRRFLAQQRSTLLETYEYQATPLDRLFPDVECPVRQLLTSLRVLVRREGFHSSVDSERHDLEITLKRVGERLGIQIAFNSCLLSENEVRLFWSNVQSLLARGLEHPDCRIGDLEMLTTKEKSRVVEEWNRTDRKWGSGERCFQELLEARVERSPEAIAAVCGEESWTYRELNDRANRLAHYLRGMGVGPEVGVGVCVERGLAMMVGILGILKAGGAYVPMDPEYPTERLRFMLQDSGVSVLLVQRRVLGRLPKATVPMVDLEEDWEQIAKREQKNPVPVAGSENAAYIIYTSGSTGRPKGVVICHGGLANLALALSEAYAIVSQDKVLQFASNSYDAAVSEWSTALLSGASLVLPKAGTGAALEDLQRLGEQGEISVVTLPPSVLATVPEDKLAGVKTLIVAGEACSSELVRHWSRGRRMLNAYGPTETTVCATISSALQEDGDCPIGRPLANTQVYVLEESLQPAPAGVVGELYIGGAGLARGYRNRPDLTAERFIPHPFSRDTGKRLYRSGDLARWRADGTLEYVGRRDEQVKIRGHRIELGEIETALRSIPGIRDAAVVAREDTSGSKHLIAYITDGASENKSHQDTACQPLSGSAAGRLKAFLAESLPEYMLPTAFVSISIMPLSANGKLDRAALPAPNSWAAYPDRHYVAPCNELEVLLCDMWVRVLGRDNVGKTDNFFELGGNSLKAARVVLQISKLFGVECGIRKLFESPTVEAFALAVEQSYCKAKKGPGTLLDHMKTLRAGQGA